MVKPPPVSFTPDTKALALLKKGIIFTMPNGLRLYKSRDGLLVIHDPNNKKMPRFELTTEGLEAAINQVIAPPF